MQAGRNHAEAVHSDPLENEPCTESKIIKHSLHFLLRSKSSIGESSTYCHFLRACRTKHSMLVNVELAEHFRQESLKLSRLTYKVRLLLIIRTEQQQRKKSTEILLSDRSTLKITHVSVRRWLQPPNLADLFSTCLLPTLLVGLTSLSQPNSPSTFHHFLLAAEIRSFLTLLHSQSKHQVLTAAGSCLPGPSQNSSLFRK